MGIVRKVIDQSRRFRLRRRLGPYWGDYFFQEEVWPSETIRLEDDGSLYVDELGIKIPQHSDGRFLVKAQHSWKPLRDRGGVRFEVEGAKLFAIVDDLKIRLSKPSDVSIFREVFLEQLYRFECPGEHLFIDAGANIGLASLYLAQHYSGPIYAFELVPSTAARAQENLDLNPHFSSRIVLQRYGLGEADQELELGFDQEDTASNSLLGGGPQMEKVKVRDAASVLQEILATREGRRLVIKLDVEGAEYPILRRWHQTGLLKEIDILMMEWHSPQEGELQEVRETLRQHGFRWFEHQYPHMPVGFFLALGNKALE